MSAAGGADAAAIERAADQFIQVAAVFDVVAQGKVVAGIDLIVQFGDAVIVVLRFQNVEIFGSDAQSGLGGIDQVQVLIEHAGEGGRFGAPLAFVIREEKYFVLLDGAAECGAELILAKNIRIGRRLEERTRVGRVVLQVIVNRTVQFVAARFGDDVDDAAESAAVFRAEGVIDDAKFLHGFLRRRRALRAGGGVDVVRAVYRDHVAEVAHAGEGDAGGFKFGDGGLQAAATGGDAGG